MLKHTPKKRPVEWRTVGTAFLIRQQPLPTFITCAHVLLDGHQRPRGEFGLFCGFGKGEVKIAGVRIEHVAPEIDAAVFVTGFEPQGTPATFEDLPETTMGSPVAALGVPLPEAPAFNADGSGSLRIQLRLSAGWVSSDEALVRLPETLYTDPDLKHLELYLHAYPGISGGPLFNPAGNVIGMVRGTRLVDQKIVVPYGYAVSSRELRSFLDVKGVSYEVSVK